MGRTLRSSEAGLDLDARLQMVTFCVDCLYRLPLRRSTLYKAPGRRLPAELIPDQQSDARHIQGLLPQLELTVATKLGRMVSLQRQALLPTSSQTE